MLLVIAAVLVARTLTFPSRQITVEPAVPLTLDAKQAIGHLQQAIIYRTISAPGDNQGSDEAFAGFHRFLQSAFPLMHRHLKKQTVNGHSLIYSWQGKNPAAEPILLLAHMDVVPVDPDTRAKWTHDPFSGHRDNEFIWGRGTMDDKSSLIALCEAVEYLLGKEFQPEQTIYLVFGHDEEIGGLQGAKAIASMFAEQGLHFRFVLDEGMFITNDSFPEIQAPVALVGVAEKGYVTIKLSASDAGGHSSRPGKHTAIGRLSTAMHRLEARPMNPQLTQPVSWMLDYLGPEMPFTTKLALTNRWLLGSFVVNKLTGSPETNALVRTTAAITMASGGVKENVLPTQATAMVNFRILPGQSVAQVVRHVQQAIRDPGIKVTALDEIVYEPTPVSDIQNGDAFELLQKTITQVFQPVVVAPTLLVAGTDARHYAPVSQQIFRFQPIRLARSDFPRFHGIDERIAISAYQDIIAFYVALIQNTSLSEQSGASQ